MFCKKCGSLLKAKLVDGKKVLGCSCGYSTNKKTEINLQTDSSTKKVDIVDKDEPASRMIIDEECPKCGNPKAYYWTQQTGPSDEPEDQVYRCVKCGHGWRERY